MKERFIKATMNSELKQIRTSVDAISVIYEEKLGEDNEPYNELVTISCMGYEGEIYPFTYGIKAAIPFSVETEEGWKRIYPAKDSNYETTYKGDGLYYSALVSIEQPELTGAKEDKTDDKVADKIPEKIAPYIYIREKSELKEEIYKTIDRFSLVPLFPVMTNLNVMQFETGLEIESCKLIQKYSFDELDKKEIQKIEFTTNKKIDEKEIEKRIKKAYWMLGEYYNWLEEVYNLAIDNDMLKELNVIGSEVIYAYKLEIDSEILIEEIGRMIKSKTLKITDSDLPNGFKNEFINEDGETESMTAGRVLETHGVAIAHKIQRAVSPIFKKGDKISKHIMSLIRKPYKAQSELMEAAKRVLKKQKVVWAVSECGTGKSLMLSGVIYDFVKSVVKRDYSHNIYYGPPHLVDKMKEEIYKTVPNSKCYIIKANTTEKNNGIRDLYKVKEVEHTLSKKDKHYFYIIDQQVARNGSMLLPMVRYSHVKRGFICPDCGEIITKKEKNEETGETFKVTADVNFFSTHTQANDKCDACGAKLWGMINPNLPSYEIESFKARNINYINEKERIEKELEYTNHKSSERYKRISDRLKTLNKITKPALKPKQIKWYKVSGINSTFWFHIDLVDKHIKQLTLERTTAEGVKLTKTDEQIINTMKEMEFEIKVLKKEVKNSVANYRRYPVSKYMKKKWKGKIDVAFHDELQEYKGDTGRGRSYGDFVKLAKKSIGGTGSLVNGYPDSVWFLLWRSFPSRMKELGWEYNQLTKFIQEYGIIERVFKRNDENTKFNQTVLGKKLGNDKKKPGISPRIFSEFLIDNAIFLNLEDIDEMPDKIEEGLEIELEREMKWQYDEIVDAMKNLARDKEIKGHKLVSSFIHLLKTYLDMPYDNKPIIHPDTKQVVYQPPDLPRKFRTQKEEKVIEYILNEKKQGRKCLLFVTYVNTTDVTDKLFELSKEKGLRTAVLTSSHLIMPDGTRKSCPKRRRGKMVEKLNIDCLITNPELIKTGLDLYEYVTIIHYQMSTDTFTIRQANGRSYRLGQKRPIKIVYAFYKDTVQEDLVSLMATKIKSSLLMEGQFTSEGLNALADTQSVDEKLAENLMKGIREKVRTSTFTKGRAIFEDAPLIQDTKNIQEIESIPFEDKEVQRNIAAIELEKQEISNLFQYAEQLSRKQAEIKQKEVVVANVVWRETLFTVITKDKKEKLKKKTKKSSIVNKILDNQLSFLDI